RIQCRASGPEFMKAGSLSAFKSEGSMSARVEYVRIKEASGGNTLYSDGISFVKSGTPQLNVSNARMLMSYEYGSPKNVLMLKPIMHRRINSAASSFQIFPCANPTCSPFVRSNKSSALFL